VSMGQTSLVGMRPIIGSEALRTGALTRGQLRWRYTAIYPDVYVPLDTRVDLHTRAFGAWLWSGRTAVIAGATAANLHGVFRHDGSASIELIAERRRTPPGVTIRQERIGDDELSCFGELPLTSPARTALDLARRLPRDEAVIRLDKLAAVTDLTRTEIAAVVDRYSGARGIEQARSAIDLMEFGGGSAMQTRLRLMLIDGGLPRPETGILVGGDWWSGVVIVLGWPLWKVGVGFADKRTERSAVRQRILRQDAVHRHGWVEVHVDDNFLMQDTAHRVREAIELQRVARDRT
jgi:AbiEi antitoxin C-terminal domain